MGKVQETRRETWWVELSLNEEEQCRCLGMMEGEARGLEG